MVIPSFHRRLTAGNKRFSGRFANQFPLNAQNHLFTHKPTRTCLIKISHRLAPDATLYYKTTCRTIEKSITQFTTTIIIPKNRAFAKTQCHAYFAYPNIYYTTTATAVACAFFRLFIIIIIE